MRDFRALTIPSIGRMREHIVICDKTVQPSPDDTLEIIQRRSPLGTVKAMVEQTLSTQNGDYRLAQPARRDEYDFAFVFRIIPGLFITVGDFVFWGQRRRHMQLDRWFKISGIDSRIQDHRFTCLECNIHTVEGPSVTARGFDQPIPIRGQEPIY